MRLSRLHICHFRCFSDATIIFDDYTCFVGPNGSGKSTVLMALNVWRLRHRCQPVRSQRPNKFPWRFLIKRKFYD
jgi:recombinational DNA repair ATPase RecF